MKKIGSILAMTICLTGTSVLAAKGTIQVEQAKNRANTLDITIAGKAAQMISDDLFANGFEMRRDVFSGAMVQSGKGVRCVKDEMDPVYCYIAITRGAVVK